MSNECVCLFLFLKMSVCSLQAESLLNLSLNLQIGVVACFLVMDVKRLSQGTTAVGVSCEMTISW